MIQAKNIKKKYGNLEVLKGIDLNISAGEILSITGTSGAGKTTLLQILGTLDNPSSGELFIDKVNVNNLNEKALSEYRNKNIGFVFQFHHLLPEFTALENICIPAFIAKRSKSEAEAEAIKLLDYMGLRDRSSHKPSELSGGEQQRIAIARAMVNRPKVIFADEPSGNLDQLRSQELHDLFFKLRAEFGQTYVIVTHNKALAESADRQIVIKDGQLV